MKKKNNKAIAWIVAAVILAVIIFMYSQDSTSTGTSDSGILDKAKEILSGKSSDRGNNGWYHAETDECWSTPTSLNGGNQGGGMIQCCHDEDGYQVDCEDRSKRLSDEPQLFAVYWPQGYATSTPEIFYVSHSAVISNTGAIDLDKVWISSATWTSSNSVGNAILNANYSRIVGPGTSYAGPILVGGTPRNFPSNTIRLQDLDSGSGTNYTLTLVAQATAADSQLNSSQTITRWMYVKKESIGFSVDLSWA